jgi:iron complex outermembrane receptor protein
MYLPNSKSPMKQLALAVAMAMPAGAALAQGAGALEEVVVTATKRQQTLQEVPVAVSVVTAKTMEQAQVLDIKDLQTLVPSLRVSQLQSSANTNFIIRGFGNGANNAGIEPSVGVFIDGIYRSRVGSSLADLPKLERVEVLRGPQSTLFGKNASAGVVSVVTAKPDTEAYSGSVSATVGNYNQRIIRGDVTGPLTDNLAFSLFGSSNQRDGYYKNLALGTELNDIDRWNFRGQLLWTPTDRLEARLIVDAESVDEVCCGVANIQNGPTGAAVQALGGSLVPNDPFAYEGFYDFDPESDISTRGTSLEINYDFDFATLTSITAYRTLDQYENGDVDFTSAPLIAAAGGNAADTQIDTFTQELRLTSDSDGPLNWVVGAFYFTEEVAVDTSLFYGPAFRPYADILSAGGVSQAEAFFSQLLPGVVQPGVFFAPGQGQETFADQDDDTLSLFAQVDYDLSDSLVLTAGINYTEVEKTVSLSSTNSDLFSQLPLSGPLAPLAELQFQRPIVDYPNAVESGQTNDDQITWTLRLAYDINSFMNAYVGASTGFKASSWNLSRDTKPLAADIPALVAAGLAVPNLIPGTRFAGPEDSTVYEIGIKAEYETVAFNAALFMQEIEGFQSNVFTGTGFNLANAGKQSTDGIEFDITWAPVDGLRVAFAATWLDPLYDSFVGANGVNGPVDLSGTQPAGISELSTNTNITYNFDLGSGPSAYVRVEHVYEDEVQAIENVPAELASREVNMFNASAGVTFDHGWELNLWGRNLNGDEFIQQAFPSVAQAGSFSAYPNAPRTYGLTLRKNFD